MNLKYRIDTVIKAGYSEPRRTELLTNKASSKEFLEWQRKMDNVSICNLPLLHDTTSQNMGLTTFLHKGNKTPDGRFEYREWFYIQKSLLGNFVTLYGMLESTMIYEDHEISLPKIIVYSPLGPFKNIFPAAWQVIRNNYPGCEYVPGFFLQNKIDFIDREYNSVYSLLFGSGILSPHYTGDRYFRYE